MGSQVQDTEGAREKQILTMAEEEPTLSETVAANDKGPTDNILPGGDEAVGVTEVGADDGQGAGVSENVNGESEKVEVESSSQADEDVEDALDVSKTTTELSSDLNDINEEKDEEDKEIGKDEATEVAEVGGSKGGEVEVDISEEDKQMIKNMFEHFDSDKSGKMSVAELGNFMRAIGMFPTDEVGDLLEHIDDDGSGMVDYSELMKHMAAQIEIRKSSDPEHDFKEAFLIFDKDSNGRISREELTKILTEHGRMPCSITEAEEFIAMVDEDNDGMLNYKEFVTLFTEKIGL